MKITFSQPNLHSDSDSETLLHLEPVNDGDLNITIERASFTGTYEELAYFYIEKKQLRGFIGALLHIQSKMK